MRFNLGVEAIEGAAKVGCEGAALKCRWKRVEDDGALADPIRSEWRANEWQFAGAKLNAGKAVNELNRNALQKVAQDTFGYWV